MRSVNDCLGRKPGGLSEEVEVNLGCLGKTDTWGMGLVSNCVPLSEASVMLECIYVNFSAKDGLCAVGNFN